MTLRVEINQAEAFRRGIDAPKSIAHVEVDPSKLDTATRNLIADHLSGIDLFADQDKRLVVVEPTLAAIIAALTALKPA